MAPPSVQNSLVDLFKSIGLPQSKAAEAAKNPKSAAILRDLIDSHNLSSTRLSEKQSVLVSALAVQLSKVQDVGHAERAYILQAIFDERLKSVDQVTGSYNSPFLITAEQNIVTRGYQILRRPFLPRG